MVKLLILILCTGTETVNSTLDQTSVSDLQVHNQDLVFCKYGRQCENCNERTLLINTYRIEPLNDQNEKEKKCRHVRERVIRGYSALKVL
jgi:hypothetical protein